MRSRRALPVRRLADGRACLNVGSSARVSPNWNNLDSSWLVRLARYPGASALFHRLGLISDDRYARLRALVGQAILRDLSRGIPFSDESFDVVYHSHVLEHIEHGSAPAFLAECFRVLKPGGILRVVVPDLEYLCRRYLDAVQEVVRGGDPGEYSEAVESIFEQMVRREPRGRALQPRPVRILESLFIGDTGRAGELHRWMYDSYSLGQLFEQSRFLDVRRQEANTSLIAGWTGFNLDTEPDGTIYKPGSLYLEGRRPQGGSVSR